MDVLEHTKIVVELSDKIAEVNRRILERSKSGEPDNSEDRRRLDELMHLLDATCGDDGWAKAA